MDNKKTYNLSISKTNDDGTSSNITLSTPYSDEVMSLLRLSGMSPTPAPVAVIDAGHEPSIEKVGMPAPAVDMEAGEEMDEDFANEPNPKTMSQQTSSEFSLKRNMQKLNNKGKDGGDNRLGESVHNKLAEAYAIFKKKRLIENEVDTNVTPEEVAKENPVPNKVSMNAPKNVPIPIAMNETVGTQRGLTVLNKITNVNNGADIYAMEDPGTYISPFLDKQYNYKV